MRIRPSHALALAVLFVAGCGSSAPSTQPAKSSSPTPETLSRFVAAANAVCVQLEEQQNQVVARFGGHASAGMLRAMAGVSLEADRRVEALPLPLEERDRVAELRASYFKEVPATEAIATALEEGDRGGAEAASWNSERLSVANAAVARSLGMYRCAKAAPPEAAASPGV